MIQEETTEVLKSLESIFEVYWVPMRRWDYNVGTNIYIAGNNFLLDGTYAQHLSKLRIMPGTSPVILILGAGPNIGQAVAQTFASKGYKVALAARSLREADSTDNQLNIASDFANPDDVVNAITRVKKVLGIPSVVVYNGKSRHRRTLAECLLIVRSWRLDALPFQGPVRDPTGCFQSRYEHQHH